MITQKPVDEETATVLPRAAHFINFGPGGIAGHGDLTHRNKHGIGVRIIIVGVFDGTNAEDRYKADLLDRDSEHAVKYGGNWVKEHGAKLEQAKQGETFINTKFSLLL